MRKTRGKTVGKKGIHCFSFRLLVLLFLIALVIPTFFWRTRAVSARGDSLLPNPANTVALSHSGSKSVLCILAEFPDVPHAKTVDDIRRVLDEMARYWNEVSYSKLSLSFTWTDWLRLPHNMSYYGGDYFGITDMLIKEIVGDAVQLADPTIDFGQHDFVMIVHSGPGQEISSLLAELAGLDQPNRVWSCALSKLDVSTSDGVSISEAAVVPEEERGVDLFYYGLLISKGESYSTLGAYVHEFGHLLGLPDLYDKSNLWGEDTRVGVWDVMASGAGAGNMARPSQPMAWCRTQLGWILPANVTVGVVPRILELNALEQSQDHNALVIQVGNGQSYFIEHRLRMGFDDLLPDEGILITRVEELEQGKLRIETIDSTPGTDTKDDALFKPAGQFNSNGLSVLVLEANRNNCALAVSTQSFIDSDKDGLPDFMEQHVGTDLNVSDSDHDGLTDGEEVLIYGTDPLKSDMDGDGASDMKEVQQGTDPNNPDSDGDSWSDGIDWFPLDSRFPSWIFVGVGAFLLLIPVSMTVRKLSGEKWPAVKETVKYRGFGVFLIFLGILGCYGVTVLMFDRGIHILPPYSYYIWGFLAILIIGALGLGADFARKGRDAIENNSLKRRRFQGAVAEDGSVRQERRAIQLDPETEAEVHEQSQDLERIQTEIRSVVLSYLEREVDRETYVGKLNQLHRERKLKQMRIAEIIERGRRRSESPT